MRKLVEHVDYKRNIWLCLGEKYEFPNHVLVQENVNYWGLHVRFEFQTKMHGNYSCITLYIRKIYEHLMSIAMLCNRDSIWLEEMFQS